MCLILFMYIIIYVSTCTVSLHYFCQCTWTLCVLYLHVNFTRWVGPCVDVELWGWVCPKWPRWTFYQRKWCPTPRKLRHPLRLLVTLTRKQVNLTKDINFTSAESELRQCCHVDLSDEEEDEEITAPPPVEGAQEEKEEQGEQQVEGKDTNTGTTKLTLSHGRENYFFSPFDQLPVYRYSQGANWRREAAGAALRRLFDFLWTWEQNCGESSGWAGGRLLWLQRQRSWG